VLSTACTTTQTPLNRDLIHKEKIQTVNLNQLGQNIRIELANSSSGSTAAALGSVGGAGGALLGSLLGSAIDAGTNSKRVKAFTEIQDKLNDINLNAVLHNALEHNLVGSAFSESLIIDTEFDRTIKKPYLKPILTANVVMSSNLSTISISLKTSTTQKNQSGDLKQYNKSYFSQQFIDDKSLGKEGNKQFWIDNPIVLKEKLVNGLYHVASQFAEDYNLVIR